MKGVNKMSDQSIRISLEAYQELVLRKISTGVPIGRQIEDLLKIKQEKKGKNNKKGS